MRYEIQDAINTLVVLCNKRAVEAGWYNDPATGEPLDLNIVEMLARIQTEINNANLPAAVIRRCDLAGYLDMDLGGEVIGKLASYRRRRTPQAGNPAANEGGRMKRLHAPLPLQGESPAFWAIKTRCLLTVPPSLIADSLKDVSCRGCLDSLARPRGTPP